MRPIAICGQSRTGSKGLLICIRCSDLLRSLLHLQASQMMAKFLPLALIHPMCLEGAFCEVSASSRGTLQRKEGDVVLLLPPLPGEAPQLLHQGGAKIPPTFGALAQETSKAGRSEHLAFRVMPTFRRLFLGLEYFMGHGWTR